MQVGFIGAGHWRGRSPAAGETRCCARISAPAARRWRRSWAARPSKTNKELAERADLVILAHKPAGLAEVAWEAAGAAKAVCPLFARTSQADVRSAYPGVPVFRLEPNTAVEVEPRRARVRRARTCSPTAISDAAVKELFARLGKVVEVPERLMSVAGALSGVGPAYWALLVEAQVDAAVRRGMQAAVALDLITETMAGSAELLRARGGDTLAMRREVASPGGTTARGLAALERGGIRSAFNDAMDDVVGG